MVKGLITALLLTGLAFVAVNPAIAQESPKKPPIIFADTSAKAARVVPVESTEVHNVWGVDILISNDGFGLGTFYRREFTPDVSGFVSLSVSESKDPREVEQIDYFGQSIVPGKLNRFLVIPLMFGVQYRLFREDIMDSFRPYVNAGVGPTMIYVMPYTTLTYNTDGTFTTNQVEFFSSIGKGRPRYTGSAFIGFGANFGTERTNIFGINFRYYFTYLFSNPVPSLFDLYSGGVAATKKDFGGFFITLNVGMGY